MKCIDVDRAMKGFGKVAELQKSAFPHEESFPMDKILKLAESDNIEYKSFWENECTLCGIMFFNIGEKSVYLFYLAVSPEKRSQGYGTLILQWLKDEYPDKSIVANIELVGFNATNEEQRVRRLAFYERNGFSCVNYILNDDSGLYDIISTGDSFDEDEYMKLILELGLGQYNPELIQITDMTV